MVVAGNGPARPQWFLGVCWRRLSLDLLAVLSDGTRHCMRFGRVEALPILFGAYGPWGRVV